MGSTRREFLKTGVGAASLTALHLNLSSAAGADEVGTREGTEGAKLYDSVWPNWVPRRVPSPQQTILFMDWRHIQCGRLRWYSPDGTLQPLSGAGPKVEAHSKPQKIAHGVRLAAEPAQKSEPLSGFESGHVAMSATRNVPACACS